jgi:hypothetical protein
VLYAEKDGDRFETTVDLSPDERRDLGDVRLAAPGRLSVKFASVPGVNAGDVVAEAVAKDPGNWARARTNPARSGEEFPLPPGDYDLHVFGQWIVFQKTPFTIVSGERTELVVTPRPGLRASVEFTTAGGAKLPERLDLVFRAADGSIVWRTFALRTPSDRLYVQAFLPAGEHYTLEAVGKGGERGTLTIASSDLCARGDQSPPLVCVLR